jgi:hypothetical protein
MEFTFMYLNKQSGIHQAHIKVVVTDNDSMYYIKLYIRGWWGTWLRLQNKENKKFQINQCFCYGLYTAFNEFAVIYITSLKKSW